MAGFAVYLAATGHEAGVNPALDERVASIYIPAGMECSAATKTRGRPREFDPEQALAKALRVFWQHGYEGASMTELTEAMGITKPSLYACFGNKEALFKKALDLYEREKLCYVSKALEAPTSREVVQRLLTGALDAHCGSIDPQGCLGVISMVGCTTEAASIRAEVIARRASSEAALVARLERAKAEGDLPKDFDAKAATQCVTAIMQGMAVKAQGGASREDLQGAVDALMTLWPSD